MGLSICPIDMMWKDWGSSIRGRQKQLEEYKLDPLMQTKTMFLFLSHRLSSQFAAEDTHHLRPSMMPEQRTSAHSATLYTPPTPAPYNTLIKQASRHLTTSVSSKGLFIFSFLLMSLYCMGELASRHAYVSISLLRAGVKEWLFTSASFGDEGNFLAYCKKPALF